MRRMSLAGSALLAAVLVAVAPAAAAPAGNVTVTSEQPAVQTAVGRHFDYRARIVNDSSASTGQLVVHLNVASLGSDVYVDPEDWSTDRSRFLSTLAPGAAASLSWDIQAVSPGTFDVYVVVLPAGPGSPAETRPSVSSPSRVEVTARRTLNAGGALPVAIAVPVLLGLATLASQARGRRLRRS
jgi:uncharacterized protein (DUF2141 family)